MKTNGDSQGSIKKRFLFSNFFANLYYFFVMHIYVVLSILGFCVGVAILLFIAELIMPKYVHLFNYSLTETTFSQLVKSHHYHAAISFLEFKDDVVMEGDEFYKFRMELADCYSHTGDYPKALEQYQELRRQIKDKIKEEGHEGMSDGEFDMIMEMTDASLAKEEFRIYMKMGDKPAILKCYKTIKQKYENAQWSKIQNFLSESSEDFEEKFSGFDLKEGFKLELLQGEYILDPTSAIPKMEDYAIEVGNSTKYNFGRKLTVFSELIRMLLEQGKTINARHYLEFALSIVDGLEYESSIYPFVGDLSDYCFQLNDLENGRRLLKKYLSHIDDTYDESDIDYALAHAKEFKYLQADGDWEELTERLNESSLALRLQIARNFTGMTEAQREYFIEQFTPIFSYASDALVEHPTDELAKICFENSIFLRGLLLRSETALANTISGMGNKELTDKYNRYVRLSQELVARQYISGPGNYFRKSQIEKEIADLESDLTRQSHDFRRDNEKSMLSADHLKKSLSEKDVVIQIMESSHNYSALVMGKNGSVKYVPLDDKRNIARLAGSIASLYTTKSTWVDKLRPVVEGKNVYLATDGIFNKISFGALPIEISGKNFGDIAMVNVVGSLADIPGIKERETAMDLTAKNTVLWGGIAYGNSNDSVPDLGANPEVILRGEELRYLPGSKQEVVEIAQMLGQHGSHILMLTGEKATEQSLTARSKKKDYILHISTHGFFHDSGAFVNPMQNSGLLFAGAQKYWKSDSLASNIKDNDGILRADEIAKLDLTGCRLVVLSACQTGLGESNTEGVYGLQRAFKLAGAQSLLMSLWSVDDAATRKLMSLFYSGLIAGNTPGQALANAQNQMRREGYSPDKWAAFVLLN